jgi:hypothetical protein
MRIGATYLLHGEPWILRAKQGSYLDLQRPSDGEKRTVTRAHFDESLKESQRILQAAAERKAK